MIIKYTLYYLSQGHFFDDTIDSKLLNYYNRLEQINLNPISPESFKIIEYTPLNEHYRPILALSELLLKDASLDEETIGEKTAIKFLDSDKLGTDYVNDIFVSDANTGTIYHFELNNNRTALQFNGPLQDKIANNMNELKEITLVSGLGRITDLKIGPDGFMYVLSSEDEGAVLYKIHRKL